MFFYRHSIDDNTTEPFTDCGGNVDDLGGAITMMDMPPTLYDCVWIVSPSDTHFKTHVYLKIIDFTNMGKFCLQLRRIFNNLLKLIVGEKTDTLV